MEATVPVLNLASERKQSIVDNTPAIFEITDNPDLVGDAPLYEFDSQSEVPRWCGLIIHLAEKYDIDARLVMAIMYMETTHGWYDNAYPDWLDARVPMKKTILPMNIHYRYWRELGVTKERLNCPFYNIEFGVIILSRIKNRLQDPTVRKIASIYNFIGAEKVTEYGARVDKVYTSRPWNRKGCSQ